MPTNTTKACNQSQHGFTLIEIMLVIAIMSIFAALVVVSISGVEQRRLMQQRDQLINDLNILRLESNDQARVYALMTTTASATEPAGYFFAEYNLAQAQAGQDSRNVEKKPLWKAVDAFKTREFSDGAFLQVRSMENNNQIGAPEGLLDQRSPDLIWFGNGESKPVRLQIIFNDMPVGSPVYVNSIGMVSDTEQGTL